LKNPLALPASANKVKPSRNRFSGLLVVPALMRLQQQQQQRKENNDASNSNQIHFSDKHKRLKDRS
jgi:hypothetical protein